MNGLTSCVCNFDIIFHQLFYLKTIALTMDMFSLKIVSYVSVSS